MSFMRTRIGRVPTTEPAAVFGSTPSPALLAREESVDNPEWKTGNGKQETANCAMLMQKGRFSIFGFRFPVFHFPSDGRLRRQSPVSEGGGEGSFFAQHLLRTSAAELHRPQDSGGWVRSAGPSCPPALTLTLSRAGIGAGEGSWHGAGGRGVGEGAPT